MKTFTLTKLDERSRCDYLLTLKEDCRKGATGTLRCSTRSWFLDEEDLDELRKILNKEPQGNDVY